MSDSDLEGTMAGDLSNREVKNRLAVSRRAPCVRLNPKSTTRDIPINVSAKAVSICNSTLEGVFFRLIY
jgi:hypothetical protein